MRNCLHGAERRSARVRKSLATFLGDPPQRFDEGEAPTTTRAIALTFGGAKTRQGPALVERRARATMVISRVTFLLSVEIAVHPELQPDIAVLKAVQPTSTKLAFRSLMRTIMA